MLCNMSTVPNPVPARASLCSPAQDPLLLRLEPTCCIHQVGPGVVQKGGAVYTMSPAASRCRQRLARACTAGQLPSGRKGEQHGAAGRGKQQQEVCKKERMAGRHGGCRKDGAATACTAGEVPAEQHLSRTSSRRYVKYGKRMVCCWHMQQDCTCHKNIQTLISVSQNWILPHLLRLLAAPQVGCCRHTPPAGAPSHPPACR